jgi:hypothetical protein
VLVDARDDAHGRSPVNEQRESHTAETGSRTPEA